MRLKLRSIERLLKEIRSEVKNEEKVNERIAAVEGLLNTLISLVQDRNVT